MDFSPEKRQIPSVLEQIWNYGIENILINMKKKTERHIKNIVAVDTKHYERQQYLSLSSPLFLGP
jgi:dTDP-glucose pyrophosphorylase